MRTAIWRKPKARKLLEAASMREVSMVTREPNSGVLYKSRQDLIVPELSACVDIKTTRDARKFKCPYTIRDYAYHRQGGVYMQAAAAHDFILDNYYIVFVESAFPHCVRVIRIPDEDLVDGWDTFKRAAEIVAKCEAAGEWPGYPDDVENVRRAKYAHETSFDRADFFTAF